MRSVFFGDVHIDEARFDEAVEAGGEVVHTFLGGAGHDRRQLFVAAVADALGDQAIVEQDFGGGDALHAFANCGQKALGRHGWRKDLSG